MGVYYQVVCHKCKEAFFPASLKLAEMEANYLVAASIGRFVCQHPTHHLELVPDEFSIRNWDSVANYKEVDCESRPVSKRNRPRRITIKRGKSKRGRA